jgi:hypothetical protein
MVASYFNGWVKEVNGKRAFRYATISGGVSRTYGTPAYANYNIPAILGRAKRQSRAEMAGYPYQMPTASSCGDSTTQIVPDRPLVACRSATKGDAILCKQSEQVRAPADAPTRSLCQGKKARSYFFIIT